MARGWTRSGSDPRGAFYDDTRYEVPPDVVSGNMLYNCFGIMKKMKLEIPERDQQMWIYIINRYNKREGYLQIMREKLREMRGQKTSGFLRKFKM